MQYLLNSETDSWFYHPFPLVCCFFCWCENLQYTLLWMVHHVCRLFLICVGSWLSCKTRIFCKVFYVQVRYSWGLIFSFPPFFLMRKVMSKCAGDYDLKVMRQEYYIHRQKVVCFFILYCGWLSKFSSLRLFGAIEHTDKRTSGLSAS